MHTDAEIAARLHSEDRTRLEVALTDHGYTIVPNDPLQQRYDGPNERWRRSTNPPFTWFIRFFDY